MDIDAPAIVVMAKVEEIKKPETPSLPVVADDW
jgi:hypothetical protein